MRAHNSLRWTQLSRVRRLTFRRQCARQMHVYPLFSLLLCGPALGWTKGTCVADAATCIQSAQAAHACPRVRRGSPAPRPPGTRDGGLHRDDGP